MQPAEKDPAVAAGHALLDHRDVVEMIRSVLVRRGFAAQDLEDGIAEVQKRAWANTVGNRPTTVERWMAVCYPIACNHGVDGLRAKRTSGERFIPLPQGDADAYPHPGSDDARDPVDNKRLLELVKEEVVAGRLTRRSVETFLDLAGGATQAEVAARLGVKTQSLYNQTLLDRSHLRRRAVAVGLGVLIGASALALVLRQTGAPEIAKKPLPQPVPSAMPSAAPQVPVQVAPQAIEQAPEPSADASVQENEATRERWDGHQAFLRGDWKTCFDTLELAETVDFWGMMRDARAKAELRVCADLLHLPPQAPPAPMPSQRDWRDLDSKGGGGRR